MAVQTGNGTVVVFGTTAVWSSQGMGAGAAGLVNYTSLGGLSVSRDELETTDLLTIPAGDDVSAYKTFVPADTVDPGEKSFQAFWEPAGGLPPVLEAPETITETYPDVGAATLAYPGHVKAFNISEAINDQLFVVDITIKLDGTPTFTP
jgi:hypothetical protein